MERLGPGEMQEVCGQAKKQRVHCTSSIAHSRGAAERTANPSAARRNPAHLANGPETTASVSPTTLQTIKDADETLQALEQSNLGYLTALPEDVLERILSHADHQTRLSLFRTCKGTQAVLLGRTICFDGKPLSPVTTLILDPEGNPAVASRALHTAAQAAHGVTLHIRPTSSSTSPHDGLDCSKHAWLDTMLQPWLAHTAGSAAADAAITATAIKPPPSLQLIHAVFISNVHLNHPFPCCIGTAFPCLPFFVLNKVQWPNTVAVTSIRWPHLKALAVISSTSLQLPNGLSPTNFPSLDELRLRREGANDMSLGEQKQVVACCAAFSQQLTLLELQEHWKHVSPGRVDTLFRTTRFPQLTRAHVSWELTDLEFCALMTGSPALEALHVKSLTLQEQHSSEECGLRELKMDRWVPRSDWVATLTRLPRTSHRLAVCLPSHVLMSRPVNPQQIATFVASLHLCAHDEISLAFAYHTADACIARMQAVLPVLKALCPQKLAFIEGSISRQLVTMVGALGVKRLAFADCSWDADASVHFWSLVPQLTGILLSAKDGVDVHVKDVVVLCCTITRPVSVSISKLTKPNQECILHAVKAAGKDRLVKLSFI